MINLLKKRLIALVLVILVFALKTDLFAAHGDVRIISASERSLLFEFKPTNWTNKDIVVGQSQYNLFQFENSYLPGNIGEPSVPACNIIIGVPLHGNVSVNIVDAEFTLIPDVQIAPVPEIIPQEGGYQNIYSVNDSLYNAGFFFPQEIFRQAETEIFRSQRILTLMLQPLQVNSLNRQVRQYTRIVVQVDFPATTEPNRLVHPRANDEDLYQKILVNYEQAKKWRDLPGARLRKSSKPAFFGNNWYKITIKGDGKTIFRDANGNEEGMYKLDGATMQAAGVPISSIDPSTIQIFNNGGRELPTSLTANRPDSLIENAIIVDSGADNSFKTADFILFYARPLEGFDYDKNEQRLKHYKHHYSEENAYWLTFGKQQGKRIAARPNLSQDGLVMEDGYYDLAYFERELYNPLNSGPQWLDIALTTLERNRSYTFNLQNVLTAAQARFNISIGAISPLYHRFTIRANGNQLGKPEFFNSSVFHLFETPLTNYSVLMNGNNTISIEYNNTSDEDIAYVDWIEVEYKREFKALNNQLLFFGVTDKDKAGYFINNFSDNSIQAFDITDYANITRIEAPVSNSGITIIDHANAPTPKKYLVLTANAYKKVSSAAIKAVTPKNLRSEKRADYIIITHDDFEQQALMLESIREDLRPDDRLETEVVKISDVINEFGWGISDPVAIRDFLAFAYNNWGQPRYVLLFGDGHYDYKNVKGFGTPNHIIPWQTLETNDDYSRTSDDFYVYTSTGKGGSQMGIGRLTVQSVTEAQGMVEKIRIYETEPEYGEWRNTFALVGDDELGQGGEGNETEHIEQAEALSKIPELGHFLFKKIYLVDYPAVKTASISGITKPLARNAFIEQINRGALIVNYVGHGNDQRLAHEKILYGPTDFHLIQNEKRMALWIAATCEFARWDQPQGQSLAEQLVQTPGRGAIAMIAASRLVYSHNNYSFNRSYLTRMFRNYSETGLPERLGDAFMMSKLEMYSGSSRVNSEKFLLIGDPAMRIAVPRYQAVIDTVDPDTIQALSRMSINGHIETENGEWADYNGKILLRVLDSPKRKEYYTIKHNSRIVYEYPGNTIFRGNAEIRNGKFTVQYIVPKDISYDGDRGRISGYFWNDGNEGLGIKDNLVVGGTATNLVDHEGPEMSLHFGEPGFAPGDYVPVNAVLHVDITDSSSGVNTAGDIGHQIIATLDDDINNAKDVTDFFEYNEGSYITGVVKYPLTGLTEGHHTIKVKGWDNSNNSSVVESNFVVINSQVLKIRNVVNYPNPLKTNTQFTFELSQDAQVEIKVYSVAGRLLREFTPCQGQTGFNIFPENWDGCDQDGDQLANGLYLYKIKAGTVNNGKAVNAEEIGKLLIVR